MDVDAGGGRTLLILDLDETLIHASEAPLGRTADFRVDAYHVYRRPHVAAFLSSCAESFRVAFWSSASEPYVAEVVSNILPDGIEPAFAWGRDRCTPRFDPESLERGFVKDLKKVAKRGFDLRRTLIVDDTPSKVARQYGNAVYVAPFFGDPGDDLLPRLDAYLGTLRDVPDVRRLEKRGWMWRAAAIAPQSPGCR